MCMVDSKQVRLLINLGNIYIGLREGWVGSFQSACCWKEIKKIAYISAQAGKLYIAPFFRVTWVTLHTRRHLLQAEVFLKILFETKLGTKFLLKTSCSQIISSRSGHWIIHNCSQAGLRKLNWLFWKWHVLPRVAIDRPAENQLSNQREKTWTLKQRLLKKSGEIDLPSLFFYPWSATLQLYSCKF